MSVLFVFCGTITHQQWCNLVFLCSGRTHDNIPDLYFFFFFFFLSIVLCCFAVKKCKEKVFESRWPSLGWSVCPIYQVMSSFLENNILTQQSREKLIRSLPSDIDHTVAFSWPASIRKVTFLV